MRFESTHSLAGKRIVITGGSRGLGQAMCREFAEQGAAVAFTYSEDREGAQKTLRQSEVFTAEVIARQCSVLDSRSAEALCAELEQRWGGIDVLVNNAAVVQILPLPLIDEEDWDQVMDINVKGVFLTTKAVLRGMIRRKSGVILNIGSIAGLRVIASPVHYAASKAAIKGFTQALAKEVGRYSIRVNCFSPGLLDAGLGVNIPASQMQDYLQHCALGRLGTLQEAARFAAFIVSDRAAYINGETVVMDGGL